MKKAKRTLKNSKQNNKNTAKGNSKMANADIPKGVKPTEPALHESKKQFGTLR